MGTVMDATTVVALNSSKADWLRALRLITPTFRIRDEREGDGRAREMLLDASFGPSRVKKTSERLREGRHAAAELSFVATSGAGVVGTIRLWDIEIGDRASLLLGPLAVDPSMRSAGIGKALIEHSLRRARKLGHESVVLVGDAPYYARFGFDAALTEGFALPGPVERVRFLGLELIPGALKGAHGRVVGAGAFSASRADGQRSRLAA